MSATDPVGTWWVSVEPSDPASGPDVQRLGVRLVRDGSVELLEPVEGVGWWRLAGPGRVIASLRIGGWALEAVLEVDGDHWLGRARAAPVAAGRAGSRTLNLWAVRGW